MDHGSHAFTRSAQCPHRRAAVRIAARLGTMPSRTAVVLAGGRSSRFGADKLAADAAGSSLLDVVLAGLPADLAVVVVGPPRTLRRPVLFVREEPAGGGPAAALVTGVAAALAAGAVEVVVLPGDAPGAGRSAAMLLEALSAGAPAAVGVDGAGTEQPLQVAMTRAAALALVERTGPAGAAHRSARSVLDGLGAVRVPLRAGLTFDVDTPGQLAGWLARGTAACRAVLDLVDAVGRPALVALDGRSGVGKSTLALAAASHRGAVVVDGDDFYAPRLAARGPITATERAVLTPEQLADEVIDWRRLRREALEPLLGGRDAAYRPYDWDRDDGRLGPAVRLSAAPLVLLEGVYSGRPELADLVSAEVLVEVPEAVRVRRLAGRGEDDAGWGPLWAAAEVHYFTHVRPPASFEVRVSTA